MPGLGLSERAKGVNGREDDRLEGAGIVPATYEIDPARLRQIRELRGLSQSAMARKAGITPQYASKLEKHPIQASHRVTQMLARALNVMDEDLTGAGRSLSDIEVGRFARRHNAHEEESMRPGAGGGAEDLIPVPIYGSVGDALEDFGDRGGIVEVPARLIETGSRPFAVRVEQTDEALGVHKGEYVIVDPERTFSDEAVHLIAEREHVVLRRFRVRGTMVQVIDGEESHDLRPMTRVTLLGVADVVGNWRSLRPRR